ncbi:MAG TPA: M14 family metallopeptidase [Longimicrobiales bacterium]|nr:M14 family metallopeptidase [Longimicrobiales bacterium]
MPRVRRWPLLLLLALASPAVAQPAGLAGPNGAIDLNRFYTADETNAILAEWARLYPELTRLYSIGRSHLGAELMVMEVTSERTGPTEEKPALYVDGGIHAGELTGSAVALHLLEHLLRGYGHDQRVTRLLDARAFYVRPKFNPDGSDLVLHEDQPIRSTVRPWDEDGDGLLDEDPANDLDGDGRILQMRYRDAAGEWVYLSEGIDDDGDGRINEDGVGGIDMNRNFPRNWEREHLQPGAGPFPLSEPETHATVRFLSERPNITGIVHGHTAGGFVYRLPSAVDPALLDERDLALILHLGEEYTRDTGRPVRPSSTHATDHRYGTLISWGYWDRGVVGWVPEYVPPDAWVPDYDGDGEKSEAERRRFDRERFGGRYFKEWEPYDHPQLGPVEIGGWHRRYWGQNPPPELLEEETRQQLHWILWLAERSPLLSLATPRVTALGDGTVRVEATVTNEGFLPTHLTARGHVGRETRGGGLADQVVRPPEAFLELEGAALTAGDARVALPHLAGSEPFTGIVTERSRAVGWTVRPEGAGARVRVVVRSGTGGTRRSEWVEVGR